MLGPALRKQVYTPLWVADGPFAPWYPSRPKYIICIYIYTSYMESSTFGRSTKMSHVIELGLRSRTWTYRLETLRSALAVFGSSTADSRQVFFYMCLRLP